MCSNFLYCYDGTAENAKIRKIKVTSKGAEQNIGKIEKALRPKFVRQQRNAWGYRDVRERSLSEVRLSVIGRGEKLSNC